MDTQAKDIDGPSGDAHGLEETQGAQGYYALEQLSDLAKSINLFTDALAAYRAQVEQLLSSGKNEAAYRTVREEIAEYEKRATNLIQGGNRSPSIMDRCILAIRGLEEKKVHYEDILKQELHDLDEQFTSLRYLSDELQIRARGLRAQKRAA